MNIEKDTKPAKEKKLNSSDQTVLYRSKTNKIIAGVAGGLGEYFRIDPNIIRLLFIISLFFGGLGAIIYLLCWLIIPIEGFENKVADDYYKGNIEEIKQEAKNFTEEFKKDVKEEHKNNRSKGQSRKWSGLILILVGGIFLLDNLGIYNCMDFIKYWPLILIFFGLKILLGH